MTAGAGRARTRAVLPQLRLAAAAGRPRCSRSACSAILVVLILPLPALAARSAASRLSITLSVLILLTALFIEKPLEFSAFPTVLLIATMLRLALNLASTRLILAHGHRGPGRRRARDRGVRPASSWRATSSSA